MKNSALLRRVLLVLLLGLVVAKAEDFLLKGVGKMRLPEGTICAYEGRGLSCGYDGEIFQLEKIMDKNGEKASDAVPVCEVSRPQWECQLREGEEVLVVRWEGSGLEREGERYRKILKSIESSLKSVTSRDEVQNHKKGEIRGSIAISRGALLGIARKIDNRAVQERSESVKVPTPSPQESHVGNSSFRTMTEPGGSNYQSNRLKSHTNDSRMERPMVSSVQRDWKEKRKLVSQPRLSLSQIAALHPSFTGDINGDGREEIVGLRRFARREIGDFYQLLVLAEDGTILWEGPRIADSDDDLIFGSWDFGVSLPEILLDVDGDGRPELLAPAPQSDVSPVYYRILHWSHGRFIPRRPQALMLTGRDRLEWSRPQEAEGIWVSRFIERVGFRRARVELTRFVDGETQMGEAILQMDRWGATIERWLKPLPTEGKDSGMEGPRTGYHSPATAEESPRHGSYMARIGWQDHHNSRGTPLRGIRALLHQDRANYYRGMGDSEDTAIGRFATRKERDRIDRMEIVPLNTTKRELRRVLRHGTPLLQVTPRGNRLYIQILER